MTSDLSVTKEVCETVYIQRYDFFGFNAKESSVSTKVITDIF